MTEPDEAAPNQRSFSLNSDEAYAALCPREERAWIPNGALPRDPRARGPEAIVEATRTKRLPASSRT